MTGKQLNTISIKEFETLFKQHYENLCRYALKYVKDTILVEELVQEVFFKIWEKRSSVRVKISVKSYLFASVRNKCLQHINHNKIIENYKQSVDTLNKVNNETPFDNLIYEETLEIFHEAMNTLPERCSHIFKLSRFEGLKYKEIADQLSVSLKTVEANISKALKTFRIYFPEY